MAGLDLSGVVGLVSGAERVHAATLRRFIQRFTRFGLPQHGDQAVLRAGRGDGLRGDAEPRRPQDRPLRLRGLSEGQAQRVRNRAGTPTGQLRGPSPPRCGSSTPRPASRMPAGTGRRDLAARRQRRLGYWEKPEQTEHTFSGTARRAIGAHPDGAWLRTGDLGVIFEGELFIVGRIKDLLIVDGRNHYPDDIEATIQEITGGRVAAIAVQDDRPRHLVAIIEVKKRGDPRRRRWRSSHEVKRDVTSAISTAHDLTGRGSGVRAARIDPDHDQRQDPTLVVCRLLPKGSVHPAGRRTGDGRCRIGSRLAKSHTFLP